MKTIFLINSLSISESESKIELQQWTPSLISFGPATRLSFTASKLAQAKYVNVSVDTYMYTVLKYVTIEWYTV